MIKIILLILAFLCFVILAGVFAGSETGLYRLSRLRLRLGTEQKKLPFIILSKCVRDGSGLLLTLLIGTNLSHYLATSAITYLLVSGFEIQHHTEIVETIFIAPMLFVFSELIPKNLFFYRSDHLMPYMSPFLYTFHKILSWSGIIKMLKFVSSLFASLAGSSAISKTVIASAQRHSMQAILQDTHEEGILSSVQTDIVNRLVTISNVHIKSVMIPIEKVVTIKLNSDNNALISILKDHNYTRLPVIETDSDNIIGFINIYEVLSTDRKFSNLSTLVQSIKRIDAETVVTDAINFMQRENQKILIVTRTAKSGFEKTVGIVTMKDLVEELLGELGEW